MHHHAHNHQHRQRRLLLAFVLTATMLVVEVVGGLWSGSLALLTDAAHMLVDAIALFMAVVSAHVARRPADALRSYGYQRMEVLSGFANAILQLVLIAFIVAHALARLWQPVEILSGVMLSVAVTGLVVNLIVLAILGGHHHDDVNMAGAALHVLGDLLGSVAAIAAALIIRWWGFVYADPLLSLLVSLLILRAAWKVLRRSAHILLEGVPEGIETDAIPRELAALHADIRDVHHLHVWQLGVGSRMATLHVTMRVGGDKNRIIVRIRDYLQTEYAIGHATIQVETAHCLDDHDASA